MGNVTTFKMCCTSLDTMAKDYMTKVIRDMNEKDLQKPVHLFTTTA